MHRSLKATYAICSVAKAISANIHFGLEPCNIFAVIGRINQQFHVPYIMIIIHSSSPLPDVIATFLPLRAANLYVGSVLRCLPPWNL